MQASKPLSSLRSDAQRNRLLLLEAAAEVLREQGLDASLEEISRRAGVGNATLYRHFPNREKLYEAVYAAQADERARTLTRSLAMEDSWEGLVYYFERACHYFATDRGLADLLNRGMPESPELDRVRSACQLVLCELLGRAQGQGVVRADVVQTDLMWILSSLQHVVSVSDPDFPDAWRRYLAISLRALRTPGHDSELPATDLTPDSFHELLCRPREPKHTPRRGKTG
ncbi:MAG TPA: helix-turn-helix domain-containing protein [Pseudonocardia sp.]|jgi:AcrR family transcriptional regulator|nr:helix-turn-helix domain-containing protein [Pseudonocardia sp.]